jgi:hypothetical protein
MPERTILKIKGSFSTQVPGRQTFLAPQTVPLLFSLRSKSLELSAMKKGTIGPWPSLKHFNAWVYRLATYHFTTVKKALCNRSRWADLSSKLSAQTKPTVNRFATYASHAFGEAEPGILVSSWDHAKAERASARITPRVQLATTPQTELPCSSDASPALLLDPIASPNLIETRAFGDLFTQLNHNDRRAETKATHT